MIPVRDKNTDISSEVARGKQLKKMVEKWAKEIATDFIESGTNLNDGVARIAKTERLNELKIQRLVEETNTVTYNQKYDKLRNKKDRRVVFELADLAKVRDILGDSAPQRIENPNLVKGKSGEGNMQKKASEEIKTLHNPHSNIQAKRERLLEKQAADKQKEMNRLNTLVKKEVESGVFKIATSLVTSEKLNKNASEVYNTMLGDAELTDEFGEMIAKQASDISKHLVETKRIQPNFVLSLEKNVLNKKAEHFLGEFSLLKQANYDKVEDIKVAPTADIEDYSHLIELAKDIQKKHQLTQTVDQKLQGE